MTKANIYASTSNIYHIVLLLLSAY